jgi:hypothetical protein
LYILAANDIFTLLKQVIYLNRNNFYLSFESYFKAKRTLSANERPPDIAQNQGIEF